jgi:hypothetical protein
MSEGLGVSAGSLDFLGKVSSPSSAHKGYLSLGMGNLPGDGLKEQIGENCGGPYH